jgi:hypothetical protein
MPTGPLVLPPLLLLVVLVMLEVVGKSATAAAA